MTKTETETIEYKKSLAELKEGLISIVAILNKHKPYSEKRTERQIP